MGSYIYSLASGGEPFLSKEFPRTRERRNSRSKSLQGERERQSARMEVGSVVTCKGEREGNDGEEDGDGLI
jgi:hypothetical protein